MRKRTTDRDNGREWPVRWKDAEIRDASAEDQALHRIVSAAGRAGDLLPPTSVAEQWGRFDERRSRRAKIAFAVRIAIPAVATAASLLFILFWSPVPPPSDHGATTRNEEAPTIDDKKTEDTDRVVLALVPGKSIELSAGIVATAALGDSVRVLMQDEAHVEVLEADEDKVRLKLTDGELLAQLRPGEGRKFVVEAGRLQVRVTGTVLGVRVTGEESEVSVWRGSVEVDHNGTRTAVSAGDRSVFRTDDGRLLRRVRPRELSCEEAAWLGPEERPSEEVVAVTSVASPNVASPQVDPQPERAIEEPEPEPSPPEELDGADDEVDSHTVAAGPHHGAQAESGVPARERAVRRKTPKSHPKSARSPTGKPRGKEEKATTQVAQPPIKRESRAEDESTHGATGTTGKSEPRMALTQREEQFASLGRGGDENAESALFSLGALRYDRLNDRQGAISAWEECLQRFPQGVLKGEVHAALFDALVVDLRPAEAVQHGEAALEEIRIESRRRKLRLNLAEVLLLHLDEAARARAHLEPLTDGTDIISERATFLLAGSLERLGDIQAARATVKAYLARFPDGSYRKEAQDALSTHPTEDK